MKTILWIALASAVLILIADAIILWNLYAGKTKTVVSEVLRTGVWTTDFHHPDGVLEPGLVVVKDGTLVNIANDWIERGQPQLPVTKDGKRVGTCTTLGIRNGILVAVCTGIPDDAILDPELEAATGTAAGKPALMPTRIHSLRIVEKRRWN